MVWYTIALGPMHVSESEVKLSHILAVSDF